MNEPGGEVWRIEARKYDQRLHYTFPAILVQHDGERLTFRAQIGGMLNHVTRGWARPITKPFEMICWTRRWYNVYLNYESDSRFSHFYCNVALPPALSDHTLAFVDLDLDVRMWPDGRVEILDEDEFVEHAAQYGYPDDVQKAARRAISELLELWWEKQPPFDR